MIVAIPNVTRTIQNSRRDTFVDNAKALIDAVRVQLSTGDADCSFPGAGKGIWIDARKIELESGAIDEDTKSTFNQKFKTQRIAIINEGTEENAKFSYYYFGVDEGGNGIGEWKKASNLARKVVAVGGEQSKSPADKIADITLVECKKSK